MDRVMMEQYIAAHKATGHQVEPTIECVGRGRYLLNGEHNKSHHAVMNIIKVMRESVARKTNERLPKWTEKNVYLWCTNHAKKKWDAIHLMRAILREDWQHIATYYPDFVTFCERDCGEK